MGALNPKTKRVALKLSEPMLSTLAVLFAVAEDPRLAEGEQEELMPFPTELRASDLAHREQELGARLPDDIVALLALRIPILFRATGIELSSLEPDLHAESPIEGWIAIATAEAEAMEYGYREQGGPPFDPVTLCLEREASKHGDPGLLVCREEKAPRKTTLSEFMNARVAAYFESEANLTTRLIEVRDALWDAAKKAPLARKQVEARCKVVIVDDLTAEATVRVHHAKFGAGAILSELEGGKVEILFDSGEKKTLQKSFIRTL